MVNWSARTQHVLRFNSNNTTQVKTTMRKVPIDKGKARINDR